MLYAIFELWLIMAAFALVVVLPITLLAGLSTGARGPERVAYNDAKAARIRAKPQRVVFWWLPHDQGP